MPAKEKPLHSILVKPAGPDCNMACAYCFYLEKDALFPETATHRMSEPILEEMIRQCMAKAGPQITFGWQGGEPTLMGLDFFEKAVDLQQKYGRGQTVGNGLQTNGLLIDDQWAAFLARYKVLVGLSLDGPEHVHDRYRFRRGGSGSWSRVVDRAKLMLDAGVAVNALTVINDYSVRFPEEIYRFHKELGLTFMQFIPFVTSDSAGRSEASPFMAPAQKYGQFLCQVFDLWHADFDGSTATTSIRFFDALFHLYVDLPPPDCSLQEECGVYLVVEHNGDVYSCDFYVDPEWKLGNILQDDLVGMLNSTRQRAFGRMKAELPKVCEECQWLRFCRGGCTRDRTVDSHGRALNHYCRSFKIFFEHAHDRLTLIAKKWKEEEALAQEAERRVMSQPAPADPGAVPGKVGRNAPCPCGSGLKFKKCCGRPGRIG
jgi:uncharacterized protein